MKKGSRSLVQGVLGQLSGMIPVLLIEDREMDDEARGLWRGREEVLGIETAMQAPTASTVRRSERCILTLQWEQPRPRAILSLV